MKKMNELCSNVQAFMTKKRLGGTNKIIVEVILLLLGVGAVLLYKDELYSFVQTAITKGKEIMTSIIG